MKRRLSRPTVHSAALAGIVTHLPGVFYLAALAAIVASRPGLTGGLLQVGLYNLLWYAVPLAALASWTWRPETTRENAARLTAAVQAHRKALVVAVFVLVGVSLDHRDPRDHRGVSAPPRGSHPLRMRSGLGPGSMIPQENASLSPTRPGTTEPPPLEERFSSATALDRSSMVPGHGGCSPCSSR